MQVGMNGLISQTWYDDSLWKISSIEVKIVKSHSAKNSYYFNTEHPIQVCINSD